MNVDLFDNGAGTGPRPAWQVIEAARRRYLTGQLFLETTPPTNVYLRDGQVYFAERTTDGGLGVRLLVEGVITRAQLQKATLQVSGVEHLGRMFERDDSIDRQAVELCVELMTDDVLTQIAEIEVARWTMKLYQRHPSGLDRWLPTRVEVITHLVESAAIADPDATLTPAPATTRARLAPPPVTSEVKMPPPAPVAPAPVAPVTHAIPTIDEIVAEAPDVPVTAQETVAVPTAVDAPEPAAPTSDAVEADAPQGEEGLAGLAPAAMDALLGGSIKDEVAEAVRRALASIDG